MKRYRKIINLIIFCLSIILFLIVSFYSDFGTNRKEIDNILLIAFPCLMLYFYSIDIKEQGKKEILFLYLIAYIVFLLNIVFSNSRSNIYIVNRILVRNYNIIPFASIKELITSEYGLGFAFYNLFGNFLMLTPLSIILPMSNKKFYNKWCFLALISFISLIIEITQFATNLGSFDIDDIILNISGSFILYLIVMRTKVNKFITYLFYKVKFNKKITYTFYYVFLILSVFCNIYYIYLIRKDIYWNTLNINNLYCINDNKTYLGDYQNYHLYSECEYRGYIKQGAMSFDIKEYVILHYNPKYDELLKIKKEKIVTYANIIRDKYDLKMINHENNLSLYLYGIKDIILKIDNNDYSLKDNFALYGKKYYRYLVELAIVKKNYMNYSIGDYYNLITCYNDNEKNEFIVPPEFYLSENTCNTLYSKIVKEEK